MPGLLNDHRRETTEGKFGAKLSDCQIWIARSRVLQWLCNQILHRGSNLCYYLGVKNILNMVGYCSAVTVMLIRISSSKKYGPMIVMRFKAHHIVYGVKVTASHRDPAFLLESYRIFQRFTLLCKSKCASSLSNTSLTWKLWYVITVNIVSQRNCTLLLVCGTVQQNTYYGHPN